VTKLDEIISDLEFILSEVERFARMTPQEVIAHLKNILMMRGVR